MIEAFQRIGAAITASLITIGGMLIHPSTMTIAPATPQGAPELAAAYQNATFQLPDLAEVAPELLPIVKLSAKKKPAAAPAQTATAPPKTPPPPPPAPTVITAQELLDGAALSFKQNRDGTHQVVLSAPIGNGETVTWGLGEKSLGGTGRVPQFLISYSCNPPPRIPAPDLLDQNPFFEVRAPYDCEFSLTPTAGLDQRTSVKRFTFTTGAGPLVVMPPSSMDTLLRNDTNNGGMVFDNQDTQPITITALTFDLSYTGLSVLGGPLVLRILDPATETSLADYHMENFPADPASPYTYRTTGATIPLSFTIGASNRKLLPIQVLGVHKMIISGVDPAVTVALRGIATNRADGKTTLNASSIAWSCVVALGAYDPNATSGPFATGRACKD